MRMITEVKVLQKDKNRVSLSLDGQYFCTLSLETAIKNNLKPNLFIDEANLQDMIQESEIKIAWEKALKLVSTRYKTQKEVYVYLQEKGFLPAVIFSVIEKLNEYHFIDDKRYAESYVSHKIKKDGPKKIKQQLLLKGVSEDIIDEVLLNCDNQDDVILTLVEKYMKNKEKTKENYIKMFRYMQSKGFDYEQVKNVIKDLD